MPKGDLYKGTENVFQCASDVRQNSFWRLVSIISLSKTKNHLSHRVMILWYSFATADIQAMGWKFAGEWLSPPLKTNFILASLHESGAVCFSRRIFEKRVARKWWVVSIFFMWSHRHQVRNWMIFPEYILYISLGLSLRGQKVSFLLDLKMALLCEPWLWRSGFSKVLCQESVSLVMVAKWL